MPNNNQTANSSATSSAAASPSIIGQQSGQARDVWRNSLSGPSQQQQQQQPAQTSSSSTPVSPYQHFDLSENSGGHHPPGLGAKNTVSYGDGWSTSLARESEWGLSEGVHEDIELVDSWFRTLHKKEQMIALYNLVQHISTGEQLEGVVSGLKGSAQKASLSNHALTNRTLSLCP